MGGADFGWHYQRTVVLTVLNVPVDRLRLHPVAGLERLLVAIHQTGGWSQSRNHFDSAALIAPSEVASVSPTPVHV